MYVRSKEKETYLVDIIDKNMESFYGI